MRNSLMPIGIDIIVMIKKHLRTKDPCLGYMCTRQWRKMENKEDANRVERITEGAL